MAKRGGRVKGLEKGGGEELGKRGGQALKGGKIGRARVKG